MLERDVIRARTASLPSAVWAVWRWASRWGTRGKQAGGTLLTWIVTVARGPIKILLFGRSATVSIATVLLAVVLTPTIAWWVATTTGYPPIETLVTETWQGTNPHLIVFGITGLLIALGTVSAAVNAGLLPTHLLVSAPLFGLAVTRYGTEVTYVTGEVETISLPAALEFATAVGVLGSVPITLVGFVLGVLIHRAITRLDSPIRTLVDSISR